MTQPGQYKFTILGCGASAGVPRPNGDWGQADPNNPKNRRYRSSFLVERLGANNKKTCVVIDTTPEFSCQMILGEVKHIDAVLYTHAHADHVHGIDDLRTYALSQKQCIDVYADELTLQRLHEGFSYCFQTARGSNYPPILKAHTLELHKELTILGNGGAIHFLPFMQYHGTSLSVGFRIGPLAYCTDVSAFPKASIKYLQGVEVLVLDSLQYKKHPSHFSLEEAIFLGESLGVKRLILTHMHNKLDYKTVLNETPSYVEPAFDGLSLSLQF